MKNFWKVLPLIGALVGLGERIAERRRIKKITRGYDRLAAAFGDKHFSAMTVAKKLGISYVEAVTLLQSAQLAGLVTSASNGSVVVYRLVRD